MKQTTIVKLDKDQQLEEVLNLPANILENNGTVIFPTETVYGLGANALDDSAVSQIYQAKGRPSDNPLIVHIANYEILDQLAVHIKPYAYELMRRFWPGPITFVLEKHPDISLKVTGGLNTVAVRMPAHEVALKLIELSGKPIAAPSANLSGKPSPTSAKYVIQDMMNRVDCIVDGGDCIVGLESTVLDVTGDEPIILRPGKVTADEIAQVTGSCKVDQAIKTDKIDESGQAKSPGMKYKHYAPDAEVHVIVGSTSSVIKALFEEAYKRVQNLQKVGILTFQEDIEVLKQLLKQDKHVEENTILLSAGSSKNWEEFARVLFDSLRGFDDEKCDVILVRGVSDSGIGHAIMNRLKKASDGKITRI